jgi:hypothetical protein
MVRERGEREVWAGQHTGIFKISLGVGEIEGRDRDTEIQKDRGDNKDPKKSLVAQLVPYKSISS